MKAKQCLVQFNDMNNSYYIGWINIDDAIEGKKIKIDNKLLNVNGFINAIVIKVYHLIILEV